MTLPAERAERPASRVSIVGLVLVLSAGAWVLTAAQARRMGVGPGTMGMAGPAFLSMWTVMMAAMMWPAISPLVYREASGAAAAGYSAAARAVTFGVGFLAPWVAYGALAFVALIGTGHLAGSMPETAKWLGVGILGIAGAYQLTPWKGRALAHCRMGMTRHPAEGLSGEFAHGALDGSYCVGCCWAFMAVFLAVGVMNLAAMAALATAIFGEKLLPEGAATWFSRAIGVGLLGLAVLAAIHPSLLGGLHASMSADQMGGM